MIESIEIEIVINDFCISKFHKTVSSILHQSNIDNLPLQVVITNPKNLSIESELAYLKQARIPVGYSNTNSRYYLKLTSGEFISHSFLYKALHYLKNNPVAFVSPEYSFKRIENTLTVATILNQDIPLNNYSVALIDRARLNDNSSYPQLTAIIKNTCHFFVSTSTSFKKLLAHQTKEDYYFDSSLFLPKKLSPSPENVTSKPSLRSRINSRLKSLQLSKRKKTPKFVPTSIYLNPFLLDEINALSDISYNIKGFKQMNFYDITPTYRENYHSLLSDYQNTAAFLHHNEYDYIMVLPWLIQGGIDLFAINYLKTLAEVMPNSHFLVVFTNGLYQSLTKEELNFPDSIDIIELPNIIKGKNYGKRASSVLYSLINVFKPKRLHIVSSKIGYDCLIKHNDEIRNLGIKPLFSAYNYLINEYDEYVGYSVQELPQAYRLGDIITTDNQRMKNLWVEKFGLPADDILIHNQLFQEPTVNNTSQEKIHKKILWAAHVRPEKNPEILPKIAKIIAKDNITIDCYGLFTPESWQDGKNPLITKLNNLNYHGPYNNFFEDIPLEQYDLFLYTTHTDGTPNVILEAALSGLPIISTAVGGIPDVVQDKAKLIKDSSSVKDFVDAIYDTISHKETALKNAKSLQKTLSESHNKAFFIKQVKEMLKRTK